MGRSGRCDRNDLICMRRLFLNVMIVTFPLLIHVGCSVKEDRDSCPCLLVLDFSENDSYSEGTAQIRVISYDSEIFTDALSLSDIAGGVYQVSVPKIPLHVGVWSGGGDCITSEGVLIPKGSDCPPVYMHDSDISPAGESYREKVIMRKNHCVLNIVMEGDRTFELPLALYGNVCGYDRSGKPVAGEFLYHLEDDGPETGCMAVLPRQVDASLMLVVDDGSDSTRYFALGQYIVDSGYDWTSPDLGDITVTLDYALTEISIRIEGWDGVHRYEVVI